MEMHQLQKSLKNHSFKGASVATSNRRELSNEAYERLSVRYILSVDIAEEYVRQEDEKEVGLSKRAWRFFGVDLEKASVL
jgi:hypothetical protein